MKAQAKCDRCRWAVSKRDLVVWLGWTGHRLCWQIELGIWVLRQEDRRAAMALVDSIVQ